VIRIGRGYSGDRQTREGTSVPQKDLKLPQKAELFQTVPASQGLLSTLLCPEPFDSDTLGLNVNPTQLSKPEPQTGKSIKKKFIEAEAYSSFLLHPKKRFTHLQLNSPTKALFPSNVIVDLWSCKSSFNPEGLAFFNRYVLLVYFTRIPRYKIYLKYLPAQQKLFIFLFKPDPPSGSVSGHFSTTGSHISSFKRNSTIKTWLKIQILKMLRSIDNKWDACQKKTSADEGS